MREQTALTQAWHVYVGRERAKPAVCPTARRDSSANFRSWSGPKAPRLQAWSLDRNLDLTEGERLLKARHYAAAEVYLAKAAVDAEKRGHSVPKRIQVRLLLAEAQRKQFHANHLEPNPAKLDAAELTVRSAIELAARTNDRVAYMQCLDALADIFGDQANFAAVEKVTRCSSRLRKNQTGGLIPLSWLVFCE